MIELLLPPFSEDNTKLMLDAAASDYGQQLAQQIRYERYCDIAEGVAHYDLPPERQAAVVRDWCEEVLDADVNNMQHHPFTALVGQWACREDGLSDEISEQVTRALLVHDVKEARFTAEDEGDLTYEDARVQGMAGFHKEHRELGEMLRAAKLGSLTDAQIDQIEADMNDSKMAEPETTPGKYIEIAERIGYLHSGTAAALHTEQLLTETVYSTSTAAYASLLHMAENCYGNSLERLVGLALDGYKGVAQFLLLNREAIGTTLSYIQLDEKAVWSKYEAEGKDDAYIGDRIAKLDQAADAWWSNGGPLYYGRRAQQTGILAA